MRVRTNLRTANLDRHQPNGENMNGHIPKRADELVNIARFLMQIRARHGCTLPEACGIFANMMMEQNLTQPGRWPQDPVCHWRQLSGYSEQECQAAVAKYIGDGMNEWIKANQ